MKTNFLQFKSIRSQAFTYSTGAQTFTINGADFWDVAITNKNQVTVSVHDTSAGTDTAIAQAGLSLSTNDLTIAAANSNGFDLAAGDIVECNVPFTGTYTTEKKERFDKLYQGRFLVKAIRHDFNVAENQHRMGMNLCKDNFIEPLSAPEENYEPKSDKSKGTITALFDSFDEAM